ncbi:hypothetical protein ACJVC5_00275 [Peredibacter sp. HCB2-198]|uniref:hypothetical protein n=1 Tax=Peredibacter sp. HCB2-198 TaxID=3383025 RepID=UPI0038B553BF
MNKRCLLLGLLLLAVGCGKKSTIKTRTAVETLGDGSHVTLPIVVPLSEKSISSFRSSVSDINPLFRGFVSAIMNLGASMGAGKTRLTLIQPIPEIPAEYLTSIKVKRIFFFIEAEKKKENFEFLRRVAVKISSTHLDRQTESWEPVIETDDLNEKELSTFRSFFKKERDQHAAEWEKNSEGLLLLKYNQEEKKASLQNDNVGKIFIIQTEKPNMTRKYLEENHYKYLKRVHTLSKSILVEVKKDPIMEEMFKTRLSLDSNQVEALGIGEINPCRDEVCLDLKVPDVNLVPMLMKNNAIKVDAYIDPKNAPKDFQLKGFLEFEIKIKAKI